jgi:hypothetical protein
MRSLLVLLAVALLGLGVAACGTSKATSTAAQTSSTGATSATGSTTPLHAPHTAENDADDHTNPPAPADDYNNGEVRGYGHAPTAAELAAITALIKRYYAIARAGEGAKACPMIDSGLAAAVPLDYGEFGPSYLHGGKTCAAVMSLLFKHDHKQLVAEVPHLQLLAVRVDGNHGMVLLGFGNLPERQITEVREGGVWKVAVLLDGEVE